MRNEGYYWVKYDDKWTIGFWRPRTGVDSKDHKGDIIYDWSIISCHNDSWWLDDTDLDEIDENQIVRPIVLGTVVMTPVKLTPEQIKENEEWLKLLRGQIEPK